MSNGIWDNPLLIISGQGKSFTESWTIRDEDGEDVVPEVIAAEFRINRAGGEDLTIWSMTNGYIDVFNGEIVLNVPNTDDLTAGDYTGLLSIGITGDTGPGRPQAIGRVVVKKEP